MVEAEQLIKSVVLSHENEQARVTKMVAKHLVDTATPTDLYQDLDVVLFCYRCKSPQVKSHLFSLLLSNGRGTSDVAAASQGK